MFALIGMAALVVDIGRMTIAAQHLQNVVDGAALAGARQLPDHDSAQAALQALVQTNNQETPAWSVGLTPNQDVQFFGEGVAVQGYGVLESGEEAIEVTGRVVVDYTFGRIFGLTSTTVTRSATALSTGSGAAGTGIFFAGETDPRDYGIVITGSQHYVDGSIHSNTKIRFTGSSQTVVGDFEYVNDYKLVGSNHDIQGDFVASSVQPYPVDFTWEQYDVGPWDYEIWGDLRPSGDSLPPGRYRVHGDFHVSGSDFTCTDSLFVCDDDIRFTGSGHTLDRVTLVSGDDIVFTGAMRRYSCFVDNLFAFALKSGNSALRISGAKTDTTGILFAPNGELNYDGSHHEVHHGALIGNTIEINGSDGRYCGIGDGGAGGEKSIRLIR